MTKVSVIIPNYNHARYLEKRIDTVLQQTFGDFELIILDDCSTDNSKEVINAYASRDKRISVHLNEQNSGSTFIQWNKGVSLAKGEYIWIAESDDWAELNLLETLVNLLDKNLNAGIAYCQSVELDETTGASKICFEDDTTWNSGRMMHDFYNDGKNECANYLLFRNTIPNASAVLFKKDIYLKAGPAPTNMKLCGDWMQWVKMLMLSDVVYFSKPLNYFRQHPYTVRSHSEKAGMLFNERYLVAGHILKHIEIEPSGREKILNSLLFSWMFTTKIIRMPQLFTKVSALKNIDPNIHLRFFKLLGLRIINKVNIYIKGPAQA